MENKLKIKQEELQKLVNQHQEYQRILQNLVNEIISKQGEIKLLKELIEENKKVKK